MAAILSLPVPQVLHGHRRCLNSFFQNRTGEHGSGVQPSYLSKLPIAEPPLNVPSWPRGQRHLPDGVRRSVQSGDNSKKSKFLPSGNRHRARLLLRKTVNQGN